MSVEKKSTLQNFIAATALSTLLYSGTAHSETISPEDHKNQQPDPQTQQQAPLTPASTFMSDDTKEKYGKYITFIEPYTPGLTTLLLTPSDLSIEFTEEDKNNVELQSGCLGTPYQQTESMVHTNQKIEAAYDNIQTTLLNMSETDTPIIPKDTLEATLINNPREWSNAMWGAANMALPGTMAALSLNKTLVNNDQNFAIVTMPEKYDLNEHIKGLSGVHVDYINGLQSTESDMILHILGHEIAGHAYHEHNGDTLNVDYNCAIINMEWVDLSNKDESIADIMGSRIHKEAQKHTKGLVSNADTTQEVAALRALGNLYIGNNAATMANTTHINDHVTTVLFDPNTPNLESGLNNTDTSLIPANINRLADGIVGYMTSIEFIKEMKKDPDRYSQAQHEYFQSLSYAPEDLVEQLDKFAETGQDYRMGLRGAPQDPQLHYAAVAFIHKHDLLKNVRSEVKENYAAVMDDIVSDFVSAADKYAQKLKNPDITAKIESRLKPEHFNAFNFNAFIGAKEETQPTGPVMDTPIL